ncbi:hypothetical protein N9355_08855 [Crocinitomicaceae bacterium]|nr:hypothetical protein [Crocinitomicaceae bacterium]
MKNIFLIGGILAVLFNSLAGVILSNYPSFNWMLADISILVSTGLIYVLYFKYLDNAFKAAFTFLFLISGLIRYLLCLFAPSQLENNWYILMIAGLIGMEVLIFVFGIALKKK